MNAIMEHKAEKSFESDFEMIIDVSPDSNNGLFRRYHAGSNPVSYSDPLGLWTFGINLSGTGDAVGMVDASGGMYLDPDEVALGGSFFGSMGLQLGVAAGLSFSISGADDIRELCGESKDIHLRFGPFGGLSFSMPEDASWFSLSNWLDKALITWDTPIGFNWAAGVGYGASMAGFKSIHSW